MNLTRRKLMTGLLALPLAGRSNPSSASSPSRIAVYRDPGCGCCGGWIDHMRKAGFSVDDHKTSDMSAVKQRLGVPEDLASCHTAQLDGYVIEGHVPATAIRRLIETRPQAKGLAVPGMPTGSPGMEVPGRSPDSYEVVLFGPGKRATFARFHGHTEIKP